MPFSQYLRLMDIMARMALRADAAKYFFGYVWWILEPLLWVGVFYTVFVVILGTRNEDFLPFLMVGKLSFVWFSFRYCHRSFLTRAGDPHGELLLSTGQSMCS